MRGHVFVGTSLDGFIARPDGGLDFLSGGDAEPHGFEEFLASMDALVMGRNTYDIVLDFAIEPGAEIQDDVMGRNTYDIVLDFGTWFYGEKPVFVLSSRQLPPPLEGAIVERMSGSPDDIAATLTARGIEHVYVDGGVTIQQFLRAGLIQRLIITRLPVLIGSGIPLFGELERDVVLKHVATRQFARGLVQSEYEVAGLGR